jgi:hypothetical protein
MLGDQMLWTVYNDLDTLRHSRLFDTAPMSVEVQNTFFGFDHPDEFGDMMFMKFLVINKGSHNIENACIGFWLDVDLGSALDDLVFCDTTLALAGFRNEGSDSEFGSAPPAVGVVLLQSPAIPSPGDSAFVAGKMIPDLRNLGMTAFVKFICSGPPDMSCPDEANAMHNFMLGLNPSGNPLLDYYGTR